MAPLVLFFGNPLVDISVKINDVSILEKYNLQEDEQKEIEAEVIDDILNDIQAAELSLQRCTDTPNGICVCLIHKTHRSLVANVGASTKFTLDFLQTSDTLKRLIEDASLIHVEGFFLSERFEVCKHIVENLHNVRKKMLSYNLNARYVCEELTEESVYMAENADILIGNFVEFETIGRVKYKSESVKDTVSLLHGKWKNKKLKRCQCKCCKFECCKKQDGTINELSLEAVDPRRFGKIFVVTHNSKPVLVAWGTKELCHKYLPVPQISSSDIADTTGAGDTFMAGFMHAILNDLHPVAAARYAIHLATQKIRYINPEMPPGPKPELNSFADLESEEEEEETAV